MRISERGGIGTECTGSGISSEGAWGAARQPTAHTSMTAKAAANCSALRDGVQRAGGDFFDIDMAEAATVFVRLGAGHLTDGEKIQNIVHI